jgi:hypothetical protein
MILMARFDGGCHCGAITIAFTIECDPADLEVRACQCAFCCKHASRAVSDPSGSALITVREESAVSRYRFGHRTADYLICRLCGVYVAAVTNDDIDQRAVIIAHALDQAHRFNGAAVPASFDGESGAQRHYRRKARWTPAKLVLGPSD